MAELCHVCDLFRVALFGPSNAGNEDHLDDALGNDLPRPMADAPATMGARSTTRNRPGSTFTAVAKPKPVSQLSGGTGATATPSVASEAAGARTSSGVAGAGAAGVAAAGAAAGAAVLAPAAAASVLAPAAGTALVPPKAAAAVPAKPVPKTKFSKRASRGLKSAPAYMSFDDVDVEDDDSDGELFIEDSHRRGAASRSPGGMAAQSSKATSAYSVNTPSVYRAPSLAPPAAAAPPPPSRSNVEAAAEALAGAIAVASGDEDDMPYGSTDGGAAASREVSAAGEASDSGSFPAAAVGGGAGHESMSSERAIAPDSSAEVFASGTGVKGGTGPGLAGGLRLGGERMSIPRDGSTLESARPHGQSESFHGYKGYPGYEPDTPVAQHLTQSERSDPTDSLTINPGADVSDPRQKHAGAAAPTPSSVRYPSRDDGAESESGMGLAPTPAGRQDPVSMDTGYAEDLQLPLYQSHPRQEQQQRQQQQHQHQPQVISPSATTSMEMATGMRQPEPRGRGGQVEVTTRQQRDSAAGGLGGDVHHHSGAGIAGGVPYGSETGDSTSAYGGGGGGNQGVPSPSHSQANSMASSFRNIHQVPSEDGMGSVLGTLVGTEDSANEDLQWKRSALKKFHKVMVKGEGLRVVKHNRSGGSQMRIIRYDPEIKALVWNSKRYMKKAGSANVPIVGIKRVGREGNTVSVTAAGRGTIGFEPQRIRDAKILAEALRALVDKEERSAMWRG